jgi:hypothetical protein
MKDAALIGANNPSNRTIRRFRAIKRSIFARGWKKPERQKSVKVLQKEKN